MLGVDWIEFGRRFKQLDERLPGMVYLHRQSEACKREPFGSLLRTLSCPPSFLSYPNF
jgi:hypothetical protein